MIVDGDGVMMAEILWGGGWRLEWLHSPPKGVQR